MKTLQNITVAILVNSGNSVRVKEVIENPRVPTNRDGTPVIGPLMRRVLSVKEIEKTVNAGKEGDARMSKNKIALDRRANPIKYLADFAGQKPLGDLLEKKAA